jgi:hypothetical protein
MDALRSVTAHVFAVGDDDPDDGSWAVEEALPAGREAVEVGALEEDPPALVGTPDGEPAAPAASPPG